MKVTVEFGGGLDVLFGGQKSISVDLEENATISELLAEMGRKYVQERPELFFKNGSVRPGVLVLINDADWELEGGLEYSIKPGDRIHFISTLHGG